MRSYRGIRPPKGLLPKSLSQLAPRAPRPFEFSDFGPSSGALLRSKNAKNTVILVV